MSEPAPETLAFAVGTPVLFLYRWRLKRGVVKEVRAVESVILETWKRGTRGYVIVNELIEPLCGNAALTPPQ